MADSPPETADPPTPAAKAAAKTTPRRRAGKQVALEPGKPKRPTTFVNIENPEATIAAYCGFNDIGPFRRFYTSNLVLPLYVKTLSYKYTKRKTLELLADLPYDQYWASDDDPQVVYPPKAQVARKENPNYGVALIAWQLLRTVRKGVSTDSGAADRATFTKLTECKLPDAPPPMPQDQVPSFGPFTGECELEALNRCLCLFAHIKHTTNKSQWDRRFATPTWDASVKISIEYQPDWMREREAVEVELPDDFACVGPPPTEEQAVTVVWKHASKNKLNAAYVAEMTEQDLVSQIPKTATITVTRAMLGPEVRDRIREAFTLHQVDGQLHQLTLHAEQELEKDFPALEADWDLILDVIFKHPGNTSFTCLFRLRADGESPWEYGGPPAVLRDYIEAAQGDVVSKQKLTPQHAEQVQKQIFQMTVPKLQGAAFDPLKLFGNDKERMKKAYGGYDVSQPAGRREWQLKFLPRLAGNQVINYVQDDKLKAYRNFTQSQQAALKTASRDGADQAVDLEQAPDDTDDHVGSSRARYYAYQAAIGGTSKGVGPPIELSARALQMRRVNDDNGDEAYVYVSFTDKQVRRKPKPYQVNGAAWALSTLYGKIPFGEDHPPDADAAAAAELLRRLLVPALLIADQTGFGKTILVLQIVLGLRQPAARGPASQGGKCVYKPIFLAAPQNLIRQWAREIIHHWPQFNLIISYDDGALDKTLADYAVSSSAVKAWPDAELWPKQYSYMLDKYDARNARTIFLTTPETNVERSLKHKEIKHPAVSFDPPKYDKDGKERLKVKAWVETQYYSLFRKCFSLVVVDEATKIKTVGSKRHEAIMCLQAPRWIFMTATPMINQGTVSVEKYFCKGLKLISGSVSWAPSPSSGRVCRSSLRDRARTSRIGSHSAWEPRRCTAIQGNCRTMTCGGWPFSIPCRQRHCFNPMTGHSLLNISL